MIPEQVITWFDDCGRDLPWRRPGTSAWKILISEIMLQQTPVVRVEPVWREWVTRWPTPSAMIASSRADVLRAWGKLGYPRRAMRLYDCAEILARDFDDELPASVDELLTLPGIGDYTARAIACFAFGQNVPVVDTNVRRVVARAVHGRADQGSASKRDLIDVAALLPVDQGAGTRFSAALMELGALVCVARTPRCDVCPITGQCSWVRAGKPDNVLVKKRVQKFAGTDRQVRGLLLDVLRDTASPVTRHRLDLVWTIDPAQRDRALGSLLIDGLVEQTEDGRFALVGEG